MSPEQRMRRPRLVCRGQKQDERGAAMVEFAVILPVLIVLVFGIIHFAIAFNRVQGLHAAAREGARTASIPTATISDVNGRVTEALTGINYDGTPNVAVPTGGCAGRTGEQVRVDVTAEYTISIPLLPSRTIDLQGTGVFRCE